MRFNKEIDMACVKGLNSVLYMDNCSCITSSVALKRLPSESSTVCRWLAGHDPLLIVRTAAVSEPIPDTMLTGIAS